MFDQKLKEFGNTIGLDRQPTPWAGEIRIEKMNRYFVGRIKNVQLCERNKADELVQSVGMRHRRRQDAPAESHVTWLPDRSCAVSRSYWHATPRRYTNN